MKNLSLGINIILVLAVAGLYVLQFSGKKSKVIATPVNDNASIVYINTDSLLLNYNMAKDLNEAFFKKQEDRRTALNIKVKALEKEAAAFQTKVQNNGFLSRERAEKAQKTLIVKRETLQKIQADYNQKSMTEQREINNKLFSTITNYIQKYNTEHNHDLILSTTKGGNVFYAKTGFDVTKSVLEGLNKEYIK